MQTAIGCIIVSAIILLLSKTEAAFGLKVACEGWACAYANYDQHEFDLKKRREAAKECESKNGGEKRCCLLRAKVATFFPDLSGYTLDTTHNLDQDDTEYVNCMKGLRKYRPKLTFEIDRGQMISNHPVVIGSAIVNSDADGTAVETLTFQKAITTGSSFNHETGVTIGAETRFTAGVPQIASGEVSLSASLTHNIRLGEDMSKTHTVTVSQQYRAAPRERVEVKSIINVGKMSVPYQACELKRDKLGNGNIKKWAVKWVCSQGTWVGTQTWNREMIVTQLD